MFRVVFVLFSRIRFSPLLLLSFPRAPGERPCILVFSRKDCCCCFGAADAYPHVSMLAMMTTTMMIVVMVMVCIYMRFIRQCQTKQPCTGTHNIIIFQIRFYGVGGVTALCVVFCL